MRPSAELHAAYGVVRQQGQLPDDLKEPIRLTYKQSIRGERLDSAHGSAHCVGRPNDRTWGELPVEEGAGLGHDQVGLVGFPVERRRVEVWKHQAGIGGVGQRGRIAGLVLPGLEVRRLGRPDAKQNAQHVHAGDSLSERRIEAGAALLDERKVKGRCVGDRLYVVGRSQVRIASGNRGMLALGQTRDGLREYERRIEIGIVRITPITCPPARVERQLHEVRQSLVSTRPGRFTAR